MFFISNNIVLFIFSGSIRQIMEEVRPSGLEEPLVVYILYQVLVGLGYLHKQDHLHR